MQYIPIKTSVMQPPQDDLFSLLDEALIDVQEGDLILVTSKIVAIHQGRCIHFSDVSEKRALVEQEAEQWIEGHPQYAQSPIAIKYGAMFYGAGIDESNSGEYYSLLPETPFEAARDIWQYVIEKHAVKNVGIIITDSHSMPLRYGTLGISIGFWGFHPIDDHVGKKDLFFRTIRLSSTSIVDAVSAGAAAVTGEADECTPVTIARGVPHVRFTKEDTRDEILIPHKDDIYYPVTKVFFEKD